jgi:hypothetical protein
MRRLTEQRNRLTSSRGNADLTKAIGTHDCEGCPVSRRRIEVDGRRDACL